MRQRRPVSVWTTRIIVVAVGLLYLAVIGPSIMPRGWPTSRQVASDTSGPDPWIVGGHVVVVSLMIVCIWFGQRRSRVVEGLGWTLFIGLIVRGYLG